MLGSTKAAENTAPVTGRGPGARRGGTLAEAAAANAETPAAPSAAALSDATQSRIGELNKDNIKILHDERSNAVIIMATRSDLATLRELIRSVDIQLSQVLIEVVILDLILDNNFEFGMDWLNRKLSIHGGDIRAQAAWGGGKPTQPVLIGRDYPDETAPGLLGGATSLFTVEKLNLDGVIRATVGDNNAQILASPILLTMDNKEATIQATELRYLFNGYRYNYYGNNNSSDSYQEDIQQREIGLTVKVTPRINQKGMVVLTITGTFETVGGNQSVGGKDWPTVNKREINSDIAVNNGETVILGGLNRREKSVDKAGVPYLRNIPLLGWFFRYTKETEKRSELLVFMTPYVLDTASQRAFETGRRKRVAGANADIWSEHVSGSTLAAPDPVEELRLLRGQLAGNESLQKAEEKLLQFRIEHENEIQRFEQRRQASPPPASPEQEEWEEWEGWEDWEEWHDWQEWPEDDAEPAPPPSRDDVAAMRKFFQKNPGAAGEVVMDSGAAPLRVTTALNTPGVVVLTRSQAASAGLINSLLVEMEQP
ncbi:MAG: hypothetical protein FWF96_01655 [Kiritimatiellaeota bacterium]|nr:hypothetical protein [Kiritimatiellota bacterium]